MENKTEIYKKLIVYHTEKAEIYKAKIEALKECKKVNKKK